MKEKHVTIFYVLGVYHSTQHERVSFDWAITGALYDIKGIYHEAKVEYVHKAENSYVKVVELTPVNYITLKNTEE